MDSPIEVTLFGINIFVNRVQYSKADSPREMSESGSVSDVNETHDLNADSPIVWTPFWISRETNFWLLENASIPSVFTDPGIVSEGRLRQSENALLPIDSTPFWITSEFIECMLVGEFSEKGFYSGITHKPLFNSLIRIVNKEEVALLVGSQEIDTNEYLYLGKSLTYEGFNIAATMNDMFSNHFAILGNTGSGKSCTVARVFQNMFYRKKHIPINAKFLFFCK